VKAFQILALEVRTPLRPQDETGRHVLPPCETLRIILRVLQGCIRTAARCPRNSQEGTTMLDAEQLGDLFRTRFTQTAFRLETLSEYEVRRDVDLTRLPEVE
jgi:hypothetical protein